MYLLIFDTSVYVCVFFNGFLLPCFFSYSARVVGNGLHAQRQNPEVKVRIPNPTLAEVKESLERFNQVGCTLVHKRVSECRKYDNWLIICVFIHMSQVISETLLNYLSGMTVHVLTKRDDLVTEWLYC